MKRILRWVPALCVITTILILTSRMHILQEDNARLKHNIDVLTHECDTLRTSSGKLITESGIIMAERDEMKAQYIDASNKVQELKVKLKYAQSVSQATQSSEIRIVTEVHDTVFVDSIGQDEHVKVFAYSDPWTDIRGEIHDSIAKIDYSSTDTISQVVYRVPKKWLFFRWGTKCLKVRMSCSNPHHSIVYNETIQIKK